MNCTFFKKKKSKETISNFVRENKYLILKRRKTNSFNAWKLELGKQSSRSIYRELAK